MKTNRLVIAILATAALAAVTPAAHAVLTYNSGGVNTVNTPQTDQASYPHVAVSVDGTVVNWNAGATYSSTLSGLGNVITLTNSSSFNMNGGSITVIGTPTANSVLNAFAPQAGFSGTYSMNGGTMTITESAGIGTGQVRWIGTGEGGTFNMTGGTVNLTEVGTGNFNPVRITGGSGIYNFFGGTINASESGVTSQINFFQSLSGTPTFNISGGAYNITALAAFNLMNIAGGAMNISGGLFTANQNMTGNIGSATVAGALNLTGTFNIAGGTYTDGTWTDGTAITGTLANGDPFSLLGGVTLGTLGTLTIVPEPSTYALAGFIGAALLVFRRRVRA